VVWAYCLMPNHVHLILVPPDEDGLRRGVAEAHRRYTRRINFRKKWKGHLWQERFASFPMDEAHLLAAARYVELNPVRAKLCQRPEDWAWSSARAHLDGENDGLAKVRPLLDLVPDWSDFLAGGLSDDDAETLRRHERTGRPLGDAGFVERVSDLVGRDLMPKKRGPKGKVVDN